MTERFYRHNNRNMPLSLSLSLCIVVLTFSSVAVAAAPNVGTDDVNAVANTLNLRGAFASDVSNTLGQDHRKLPTYVCTTDPTLSSDSVWYTVEFDIFSIGELKCSEAEWTDVRGFLEQELDNMDLFDTFKIEDLNPDICKNPEAHRRERRRTSTSNGMDPSASAASFDDDHESHQQKLNNPDNVGAQRRLTQVVIWYDLFYRYVRVQMQINLYLPIAVTTMAQSQSNGPGGFHAG